MTQVPRQYAAGIRQAAQQTGLPYDVVAAQLALESVNFDPYYVNGPGKSPTGAEGIAQFEPGTWASYGHGSPYNVADALAAYAKYMIVLLGQFHGSVRDALAAYNAGPGNIAAGMGYADTVLKNAGDTSTLTDTGGTGQSGGSGTGQSGGSGFSLFSLPSQVTDFLRALEAPIQGALWLADPGNWARIVAGVIGFVLLGAGLIVLAKAA